MKLYGVRLDQLEKVVETVSKKLYDGNISFNRLEQKANHVAFTLRVDSSKGPGHRIGFHGRRLVAACWHVHYDVMEAIFKKYPDARLVTCQAVYDGINGFHANAEGTGNKNIGSMMSPMCYADACECEHFFRRSAK